MNTSEFDAEFDVLYNNITSNQAPGLNRYEKSVFLTKAQNQLLPEYFNFRVDSTDGGFDNSEERQIDFSRIIRTESLSDISLPAGYVRIDHRSSIFRVECDVLFVLNEFLDIVSPAKGSWNAPVDDVQTQPNESPVTSPSIQTTLSIVPLSYNEYSRLMRKPYKFPPKGQAWRLINGSDTGINSRCFEIIAKDVAGKELSYRIRYVRRPCPIILEDLTNLGVSIDNKTAVTECELPEEIHHKILERAVTLAKISWQGATMTQAAAAAASK